MDNGQQDAWVQQAEDLAYSYTKRFLKTSAHAARAREGGYEDKLKQYVRAVAHVQSQYVAGRGSVGYDHRTIFGTGPRDREAEREWFDKQREQAGSGTIRVRVPHRLIEEWRAGPSECRGR
jgi:hypothetical protein